MSDRPDAAVVIERFDVSLSDGTRPKVAEFRSPDGTLAIHCSREDGSLWLFATGPRGGDRGHLALPLHRADAVTEWLDHPDTVLRASGHYMTLRVRTLIVRRPGVTGKDLQMIFADGDMAWEELQLALRTWAETAQRMERT